MERPRPGRPGPQPFPLLHPRFTAKGLKDETFTVEGQTATIEAGRPYQGALLATP